MPQIAPFGLAAPGAFDPETELPDEGDTLTLTDGSARTWTFGRLTALGLLALSAGSYQNAGVSDFTPGTVAAAPSLSVSYIGEDVITTDGTSFTFPSKTLGTGKIYVQVCVQNSGISISGVTIGGETASVPTDGVTSASRSNAASNQAFYVADLATATGDIVVTTSGTAAGCAIRWWLVTGQTAVEEVVTAQIGSGSNISTPWVLDLSLGTVAGGAVLVGGYAISNTNGQWDTFTGVTQRGTQLDTDAGDRSTGGDATTVTTETRTVQIGMNALGTAVRVTGIAISLS
jgi:hypothetical protein